MRVNEVLCVVDGLMDEAIGHKVGQVDVGSPQANANSDILAHQHTIYDWD